MQLLWTSPFREQLTIFGKELQTLEAQEADLKTKVAKMEEEKMEILAVSTSQTWLFRRKNKSHDLTTPPRDLGYWEGPYDLRGVQVCNEWGPRQGQK